MCGIIGAFSPGRTWSADDRARMETARDLMATRGPDGVGLYDAPGVLFGHRRLSIIDLSPDGAQPMHSPRGTTITFNGEIYNYIELREELQGLGIRFRSTSDTEVLLAAYDQWGLDAMLARLRGMFAFAIWDNGKIHLARDPVGKKPMYWSRWEDGVAFASSLTALLHWTGARPDVDPIAIEHFLACGYIPAPRTIYSGVYKLERAAILDVPGTLMPRRYHHIPFQSGRRLTADLLDELQGLLDRAVTRRLRSDVPVATFLSGGLDSSLVTALAARQHPGITAYTVRTRANNDDEFELACRIARHTGVDHRVIELEPSSLERVRPLVHAYGEPFGDSSALPTALIAEQAGKDHTVVLTGDGGDEVQGGYPAAKAAALRHLLHDRARIPGLPLAFNGGSQRRYRAARMLLPAADAATLQFDGLERLHELFPTALATRLATEGFAAYKRQLYLSCAATNEIDQHLGFDFDTYLPEDLNVKVDVATMASSVEARAPLLDQDFTDACWGVRAWDRVRPRETKRIIRQLIARVLPADMVIQRKQGFAIPIERFMDDPRVREELRDARWPVLDAERVHQTLAERDARGIANGVLRWRLWWLAQWNDARLAD